MIYSTILWIHISVRKTLKRLMHFIGYHLYSSLILQKCKPTFLPFELRNWTPYEIVVTNVTHGMLSHEYISSINLHSGCIVHIAGNDMIKMVLIVVNTQIQKI